MIDVVMRALVELGLLPRGENAGLHIGLTRGDTLWLDVFVDRTTFLHVKVSDVLSLREEVRVYHAAYGTFGGLVPSPLGHVVRDGWDIFVCTGVEHRTLPAHDALSHGDRLLSGFFAAAGAARRPAGAANVALLSRLEAAYAGSPFDAALAPWRSDEGRAALGALGEAPQHGDFVLNNVGLARDGVVVFDWEDFGKVALPGLDLCTLLVSALDVETPGAVDALLGRGREGRRVARMVEPACAALDLPVAAFRRLVPLYLLAFLQLKETYATAVHARIARLLTRVCAALPGIPRTAIHG